MPIITDEPVQDLEPIRREVRQYVALKDEQTALTSRIDEIKKRLSTYAEELGSPNDKGSFVYPVNDELTGTKSVVRQRRVSKVFSESTANTLLTEKGIFEECTKTITVLDEDAVMAAYYEGKLTDADIDTMFPEKITWALVLEK